MAGFALTNVYNNFLTTYAPKSSRYDTHKKDELKSIYNSIVKQSKDSPLFLLDSGNDTQQYAVNMKENARNLKNVISSLSSDDSTSVLDKKAAYSSDEDVVSAKYIGNALNSDNVPSFDIEVKQLASTQVNLGSFIPDDQMGLKQDTYSFDIHVNDTDYEFQFNVEGGDTNKDMEDKLSRLINRSNIGVVSSVESDGAGRSALRLESTATGRPLDGSDIFRVSDDKTSKESGAVKYFGLDTVTSEPTNAVFNLNGTERSAYSNAFTIDKAYEVRLKGVSEEGKSTTVGLKPDVESLIGNVTDLVRGYNDFITKAQEYTSNYGKSSKFTYEMTNIQDLYRNELDSIGLSFADDGTINVDKNLFTQSAQESDEDNTMQPIKDFTETLLRKSHQISLNPMNYTNRVVVEYKNPGKTFPNPYITSMYSGMMFNSYC